MAERLLALSDYDVRAWEMLLQRCGAWDQFHRVGFVAAFAQEQGGTPEAVWYDSDVGEAFYPFIRRPLPTALGRESASLSDIVSPYGYSGPVFSNASPLLRRQFRDNFNGYCRESNIVTEFVRQNPFLPSMDDPPGEPSTRVANPIYVVDLATDIAGLWMKVRKGHRQSINKAKELSVSVSRSDLATSITAFGAAYRFTMLRNQASPDYAFSDDFFQLLSEGLGEQLELWTATRSGQPIAWTLVLTNSDWAHYFLSAATEAGRASCANHLLLWTIVQDLKRRGVSRFNLGGAPSGDDALDRFKRGFSHDTVNFVTDRIVHRVRDYELLCDQWGGSTEPGSFFPAYRDPRLVANQRSNPQMLSTPDRPQIVICGAGTHGAVVADILSQVAIRDGVEEVRCIFLDDSRAAGSRTAGGLDVQGPVSVAPRYVELGARFVVGIGNNSDRKMIFESLQRNVAQWATLIHPSAVVAPSATIGDGTVVAARVVINPGSVIGENVILNTACTIDHHNTIGAHSHVAPGVHLGGEVRVGSMALIGVGAVVLPGISIGARAVVGSGAVVTRDVPDDAVVVGVPARARNAE